uniref:Uncharacterized protein n=1 Tax=Sphaerodactylus townsendi TaxID=933632 RepID=A0ACB8GCD5_9SAUR
MPGGWIAECGMQIELRAVSQAPGKGAGKDPPPPHSCKGAFLAEEAFPGQVLAPKRPRLDEISEEDSKGTGVDSIYSISCKMFQNESFDKIFKGANLGNSSAQGMIARKFYVLTQNSMDDLKVPLVNAPIMALHSRVILSKDGGNVLKDSVDSKNVAELKKSQEVVS